MATLQATAHLFLLLRQAGIGTFYPSIFGLGGFRGFPSQQHYTPRKAPMQKFKGNKQKNTNKNNNNPE